MGYKRQKSYGFFQACESKVPRLVAVSKTKPVSDILEAYRSGQRHFGENYIQELADKSVNSDILENCSEICWHFIGNLQSNKVKKLIKVPNLDVVETVDSVKLADILNTAWPTLQKHKPLKVFVQINTSGEENKGGIQPEETVKLVGHIVKNCLNLHLCGLMTIGAYDYNCSLGVNPDFQKLSECREQTCEEFEINIESIELSMGMSSDYQHAIELGSTNVRIGSTIFGPRATKINK